MRVIFYAVNNEARLSDLEALRVLGIRRAPREPRSMSLERDHERGLWFLMIGAVFAYRDGLTLFCERKDTPAQFSRELLRTALDCVERDLHKRDAWNYTRGAGGTPGYWGSDISVLLSDAQALAVFTAQCEGLATAQRLNLAALTRLHTAV